jgi:toxin-antitoxin system PIN domain toxin
MIEIPDVNTLMALVLPRRATHYDAASWLHKVEAFATTPVTEMGLVRLLTNSAVMSGQPLVPAVALELLRTLKKQPHAVFWPDGEPFDASRFTYALQGPAQVTDLHLLDLAAARGGRLATFDRKIEAALKPRDRCFVHVLPDVPSSGGPSGPSAM